VKADKARALRADFEGADGRHSNATSAARALCIGSSVLARWVGFRPRLERTPRTVAAAGTKGVRDLRDRDDRRVSVLHGVAIHMADAQAPFKKVGDRFKWGGTRHDHLRRKNPRIAAMVLHLHHGERNRRSSEAIACDVLLISAASTGESFLHSSCTPLTFSTPGDEKQPAPARFPRTLSRRSATPAFSNRMTHLTALFAAAASLSRAIAVPLIDSPERCFNRPERWFWLDDRRKTGAMRETRLR